MDNKILLVALFVDDILFFGNDEKMIKEFKEAMTQEFKITNLGLMKYFLGLEIRQDNYGIFVSHETYAKEILKKFDMEKCNPVATLVAPGIKFSKFEGGDRVNARKYQRLEAVIDGWLGLKLGERLMDLEASLYHYK
nr:retrovirus-related Pol polyprotein from transposon TNT 1-94 [Tanacetum cinerariifolium]